MGTVACARILSAAPQRTAKRSSMSVAAVTALDAKLAAAVGGCGSGGGGTSNVSKDGNAAGALAPAGENDTVIDCSLLCHLLLRGANPEVKIAPVARAGEAATGSGSHGCEGEDRGCARRPLHCAAADSNVVAVRMLLAAGAAANAKDGRGCTPLQYSHDALVARALTDAGGEEA